MINNSIEYTKNISKYFMLDTALANIWVINLFLGKKKMVFFEVGKVLAPLAFQLSHWVNEIFNIKSYPKVFWKTTGLKNVFRFPVRH